MWYFNLEIDSEIAAYDIWHSSNISNSNNISNSTNPCFYTQKSIKYLQEIFIVPELSKKVNKRIRHFKVNHNKRQFVSLETFKILENQQNQW